VGRIGYRGYTVADIVPKGKGAITISPSNIVDSKVDFNKCTYISFDKYEESPEIKIYDGDIIFVKTGSTLGKTAYVRGLKEKATLNPQLVVLKNISIDNTFLFYRMLSTDFRKNVVMIAVGGAIPTLSQVALGKIVFRIPSEEEQQKIASFFSSIDEWIENLVRQKLALVRYKKGMTQKIFLQVIRFKDDNGKDFPEWEERKAGDIFENYVNKNHNGDLPLLAVTQDKGVVYRDELDLKIHSSEEGIKNYKIIEPNNFVISLRSFQGGIEHSKIKGISSPAYTVLKNKIQINTDFYRILFKKESFINKLNSLIYGIRDGKQISYNEFKTMILPYPSITEQKKIADFLLSIDDLIEAKKSQLKKAEQWKKGLIQKLFI
jgi:type I restriction enzyme S subunit